MKMTCLLSSLLLTPWIIASPTSLGQTDVVRNDSFSADGGEGGGFEDDVEYEPYGAEENTMEMGASGKGTTQEGGTKGQPSTAPVKGEVKGKATTEAAEEVTFKEDPAESKTPAGGKK